jgi:hypothetical protein
MADRYVSRIIDPVLGETGGSAESTATTNADIAMGW